MGISK